MGTGIVSVDLSLDGHQTLSRILLAVAAAVWLALGALLAFRVVRDRAGVLRDARAPAAFTAVAGTAVIGTGLTPLGWTAEASVVLVVALGLWLVLLWPVLRHWRTPTIGASFMLVVGVESLAELGAAIALQSRTGWLLAASLAPFALGLAFYPLVLCRFDWRQLVVGCGDHWVTGGALAISTLAAGRIALAADRIGVGAGADAVLQVLTVVLWCLTLLWLPVLVAVELRWPRVGYDVRRWATVFPVGMYAACSFAVGAVAADSPIGTFASAWAWVALATWAIVACGLVRSGVRTLAPAAG